MKRCRSQGRFTGRLAGTVVVVLAALPAGCARSIVTDGLETTLPAELTGDDAVIAELEFLNRLAERPVVTNAEGLYALVLYAQADPPASDDALRATSTYAQRVREAKRLNWLGAAWDEPAEQVMQRGTVSRALAVICGIKGGVMMRLTGPTPRYATRELAYLGILSPGSEQQPMTGSELISILSKAQDYELLEEATPDAGGEAR